MHTDDIIVAMWFGSCKWIFANAKISCSFLGAKSSYTSRHVACIIEFKMEMDFLCRIRNDNEHCVATSFHRIWFVTHLISYQNNPFQFPMMKCSNVDAATLVFHCCRRANGARSFCHANAIQIEPDELKYKRTLLEGGKISLTLLIRVIKVTF